MKKYLSVIIASVAIFSCSSEKTQSSEPMCFSDMVDINQIEKVEISNNYGTILLNKEQLTKFKSELTKLTYRSDCAIKPGAINLNITMNGKVFYGNSSTGGDLIFFEGDIPFIDGIEKPQGIEVYFNMPEGMNLDNYRK